MDGRHDVEKFKDSLANFERRHHDQELTVLRHRRRSPERRLNLLGGDRLRVDEAIEIHPARNDHVAVRPADAMGQTGITHAFADIHERVGDRRHCTLGAEIGQALQPPDIEKRQDVHPVDDRRNARQSRGHPPDDARLAGVRVHDMWPRAAQGFRQVEDRAQIPPRVEFAHQARQHFHRHGRVEPFQDRR